MKEKQTQRSKASKKQTKHDCHHIHQQTNVNKPIKHTLYVDGGH